MAWFGLRASHERVVFLGFKLGHAFGTSLGASRSIINAQLFLSHAAFINGRFDT